MIEPHRSSRPQIGCQPIVLATARKTATRADLAGNAISQADEPCGRLGRDLVMRRIDDDAIG